VHPDFYPVATTITTTGPGKHYLPMSEKPKMTREDLEWLYDKCAELIHAAKPFQHDGSITIDLMHTPHEWTALIWNLLEEHFIVLLGGEKALIVQMAAPPHGRVSVMTAEPDDSAAGVPTTA
jgi:hypothetical protein